MTFSPQFGIRLTWIGITLSFEGLKQPRNPCLAMPL